MVSDHYAQATLVPRYDQLNRIVSAEGSSYFGERFEERNEYSTTYEYDGNGNIRDLTRTFDHPERSARNVLDYTYLPGTNQLATVNPTNANNAAEAPARLNTRAQAYTYDGAGNLTDHMDGGITTSLDWSAYGKVRRIQHQGAGAGAGNGLKSVVFDYGPDQNRWAKHRYLDHPDGEDGFRTDSEYQVRDAPRWLGEGPQAKAVLATYSRSVTATKIGIADNEDKAPKYPDWEIELGDQLNKSAGPDYRYEYKYSPLVWRDQYLYGSSRLGQAVPELTLDPICHTCPPENETTWDNFDVIADYVRGYADEVDILRPGRLTEDDLAPTGSQTDPIDSDYTNDPLNPNSILTRRYELTNHLGNVTTVIGDDVKEFKLQLADGDVIEYRRPILLQQQDYLPFGLSYERVEKLEDEWVGGYRYGFNGKEVDDEGEWGDLPHYDFGARLYNPLIGRFCRVDPIAREYSWVSPYNYAENSPIANVDLWGLQRVSIHGAADYYSSEDINSFHARAYGLQQSSGYTLHQARTGRDIITGLIRETRTAGYISSVVIFAHGGNDGIYLNRGYNGFYHSNMSYAGEDGALVSDVRKAMEVGEINFSNDAVVIFGSCFACAKPENGTSLAEDFTMQTGVTTIAATGAVEPEHGNSGETGRLTTKGNFIKTEQIYNIRFTKGEVSFTQTVSSSAEIYPLIQLHRKFGEYQVDVETSIRQTNLGSIIDPKDYEEQ